MSDQISIVVSLCVSCLNVVSKFPFSVGADTHTLHCVVTPISHHFQQSPCLNPMVCTFRVSTLLVCVGGGEACVMFVNMCVSWVYMYICSVYDIIYDISTHSTVCISSITWRGQIHLYRTLFML